MPKNGNISFVVICKIDGQIFVMFVVYTFSAPILSILPLCEGHTSNASKLIAN